MLILATKENDSFTHTMVSFEGKHGVEWSIITTYVSNGKKVTYSPFSTRDKAFAFNMFDRKVGK